MNDLVCDLVSSMLDEVIDSLPVDHYTQKDIDHITEIGHMPPANSVTFGRPEVGKAYGLKVDFENALRRIQEPDAPYASDPIALDDIPDGVS